METLAYRLQQLIVGKVIELAGRADFAFLNAHAAQHAFFTDCTDGGAVLMGVIRGAILPQPAQ